MKRPQQTSAPRPDTQADEAFDPWEQTRPIPLFVIAVVFALALWGLLTYITEYRAQVRAAQQNMARERAAAAAPQPPHSPEIAPGVADGAPATLALVGMGKGQAWSCASCHGAAGEGSLSTPRLAGQPAPYLQKQLQDFKSGLRGNESMALVARALNESEMESVARYYAGIRLDRPARASLGGDLARGEALAKRGEWKQNVPACFSCHGANGEGVAPGFPALAGQQSDYIFAQLTAWRAGERKNSPQALMDGIARGMSEQDMRSVADYLATLAPAPARPAVQH